MASSFLELSSNEIVFVGSKLGSEYNKKTSNTHNHLFLFKNKIVVHKQIQNIE
ncbi:hypothetical protein GRG94_000278 [Salmonella enterica subsp. enterica serovar Kentucky]|nr:hypothetical protein [Salmonella enterica subsp. enterica serovar Kentucky]